MKQYEEDEIEVLGEDISERATFRQTAEHMNFSLREKAQVCDDDSLPQLSLSHEAPTPKATRPSHRRRNLIIAFIILSICIFIALMILFKGNKNDAVDAKAAEETIPVAVIQVEVSSTEINAPAVEVEPEVEPIRHLQVIVDSINDVPFTIARIDSVKASVVFGYPDMASPELLLATAAADIRADNGDIVGDFIADGELLAKGKNKMGWCYVSPDGVVSIGMGSAEDIKQKALNEGGTFFRQYPLVMEGDLLPYYSLKGKAKRRAIGFLDGTPVIVRSHNRESVYSFAEALSDYGFSHALYLPGGEGLWKLTGEDVDELIDTDAPISERATYLIFKSNAQ